jgi:hypothetical protein
MRKFLSIFGALMLFVVAAVGMSIGVLIYKGPAHEAEGKTFVDSAVPAIAATWSPQQLLELGTPELLQNVKPEELNAFFYRLSQLGTLIEYEGATGEVTHSVMGFFGSSSSVSANYVAKARFQNGTATFRMVVMKRDGRWRMHNFNVDAQGNQATGRST